MTSGEAHASDEAWAKATRTARELDRILDGAAPVREAVMRAASELRLDAETVERRVRSIQYQMRIAKFPHHKDFATFDYGAAAVTKARIEPFCSGQFTEEAHNLILVGGTGTGKTHIAIALGTALINNGKKARFFNAVDLINALIKEQADGNASPEVMPSGYHSSNHSAFERIPAVRSHARDREFP